MRQVRLRPLQNELGQVVVAEEYDALLVGPVADYGRKEARAGEPSDK